MLRPTVKAACLNATVIVSALGYFVDIYDLLLFSIVRVASLKDLGVPDDRLLAEGVFLLNMQMAGMLIGGIIWGIIGDRRGRLSTLFGSIILYSLANIANVFVTSTGMYGALRLLAGIGLAGELGAAITLVSETLPKETRGYGTSLVAGIGVSGAILAAFVGQALSWKTAYAIGGGMGLLLLVLRVRLLESGLFDSLKTLPVRRGDFLMLFTDLGRFSKYLRCIMIGLPLWFIVGVLITFSPEICREVGVAGPVSAGTGILFTYAGLAVGDIAAGVLSQALKSRKKVVGIFATLTLIFSVLFLKSPAGMSPSYYYLLCFALGVFAGYWALFVTIAAEQFGTEVRATVATTVPNFVRGSTVPITVAFQALKGGHGLATSALYVGLGCYALTYLALWGLKESFGRDLDFLEAEPPPSELQVNIRA